MFCAECSKSFRGEEALEEHKKESGHTGPRCKICGECFKGWFELRQHESLGHDASGKSLPRPSRCPEVTETAKPWKPWDRSGPRNPIEDKYPVYCKQCKRGFVNDANLRGHQKSTYHIRSFRLCQECNTTFDTAEELDKHVIESGHTNQKMAADKVKRRVGTHAQSCRVLSE